MEIVLSGGERIIVGADVDATALPLPIGDIGGGCLAPLRISADVRRLEELAYVHDGRPFGGKDPPARWRGRQF